MRSKAKDVAIISLSVALLIGVQFALSFVQGLEPVTLLMAVFAFSFGVKRDVLIAVAFSLLRCIVFGFYPSVVIVYLIYYPLLALLFGGLGNLFKRELNPKKHVIAITLAIVCVVVFTAIDGVVSPLWFGLKGDAWLYYLEASTIACLVGCATNLVSFSLLFRPLVKVCTMRK